MGKFKTLSHNSFISIMKYQKEDKNVISKCDGSDNWSGEDLKGETTELRIIVIIYLGFAEE